MVSYRELKQERSLVVQGRVDIVEFAEVYYAIERQGWNVRTMSALVSSCVEIAHSALENNKLLPKRMSGIGEAYQSLVKEGIMTRSMDKRNRGKLNMAWGFENIRHEGGDPEVDAPGYFRQLHNTHSVDVIGEGKQNETVSKVMEKYMELYGDEEVEIVGPGQGGLTEDDLKGLLNPDYDPEVAKANLERHRELMKLAKVRAREGEDPNESVAKDSNETVNDNDDEPKPKRGRPKKLDGGQPRQKSAEEIAEDEQRIREKDERLARELDNMCAPRDLDSGGN